MKNYDDLNDFNRTANDPYAVMSEPKAKKSAGAGKIITIALCCSLLGGALGASGMVLAKRNNGSSTGTAVQAQTQTERRSENNSKEDSSESGEKENVTLVNGSRDSSSDSEARATITQTKADTGTLMTASEVYKANVNSTVGIQTSITQTNYWGYQTQAAAAGSGFIISADGYILTNYHVIENADSVTVKMYDGTSYDAKIIGGDESNDVAVLKIDASGLTPVVLGSSGALSVGDGVCTIGNPLGELTFSLTAGIVSALNRTITTETATMDLIQTDCAINSGNSGGALFNMYGEVVGIANSKYSSSGSGQATIDNIAFAIPIDNIRGIVDSIITNGYVTKPYIGVSLADLSSEAINYGLPQGAAVKKVTEGGPAEAAGLQTGDIITKFDDEEIKNSSQLISKVKKYKAGDKVKLSVYRKGDEFEVTVTIDEKKQDTEEEKKEAKKKEQEHLQQQYDDYYGYGFPDFGSLFGY
ncbi:MAG: trypsin-like peptidase domain-containing protein [Ruminococcus sp.]|nr:trypsin-like peptidase domain-containing protein [Ruminococcus sp.]